ncbi:hypothetical protein CO726_18065 [Bacillus fungorum]|uniref:Uncharacterized protein n=1 Tax=Bacillus fungorum TaxID=2039284 RepID=A0A2G6QBA3_9BACI|nr:hypothetical protein CO726_18065 [Bacillus fungorum]
MNVILYLLRLVFLFRLLTYCMPQYLFYKKENKCNGPPFDIKKSYENIALLKSFVTNLLCLT